MIEPGVDPADLLRAERAQGEIDRRRGDDLLHDLILHDRRLTADPKGDAGLEEARLRPTPR